MAVVLPPLREPVVFKGHLQVFTRRASCCHSNQQRLLVGKESLPSLYPFASVLTIETLVNVVHAFETEPRPRFIVALFRQGSRRPICMFLTYTGAAIDLLIVVLHSCKNPVVFVLSHHEARLLVVVAKVTLYAHQDRKVTLDFLPVKGSIVDGSFNVSLWCFAPTLRPNGHSENNLILLNFDLLFVGFVVPARQGILSLVDDNVGA